MFRPGEVEREWFAPDFLAQMPAGRVAEITSALQEQYGPLQSVEGEGQIGTVTLERGEVPACIVLDVQGRSWQRVAYKGGSEIGALDFTARIGAADGGTHCVVAT